MSEMSREEAIKKLEMLNDALNWQRADADECSEALQISIKALEKLQKIEALYEPQEFGKGLSREERDREVQKILER